MAEQTTEQTMEQTTEQIDLSEIETLVNKRDIKLPKLKEFAKLLTKKGRHHKINPFKNI